MTGYLNQYVDPDDPDLISAIDELPLWSAPFGYKLLDAIIMRRGMNVLDVGCGLGFPAIEVAVRLGVTSVVTGIDPWEAALDRARLKKRVYDIGNVQFVQGHAEDMPFEDDHFDLIVSNNGINNVEDMERSLAECHRVCRPGGQMVLTLNLEDTMIEFYTVFREVLDQNGAPDAAERVRDQIYSKRRPLDEIRQVIGGAGFEIRNISHDSFRFRFADGSAMLNYYVIRYWFMTGWKELVDEGARETVFGEVERRLNETAAQNGELALTIPFVTIDCRK
jgi:ubiquinone/menaquinone biosynthesis C-methylase UbiE